MHIDGACHCGYITYEAEVDPAAVGICHCTDCQVMSGSAFRITVRVPAENFKLLTGKPKIYVKTTADSGNPRAQGFCPECGSPIYATSVSNPQVYGLRVATARQRALLPPKRQGWCRSALDWVTKLDALPRVEKQAP